MSESNESKPVSGLPIDLRGCHDGSLMEITKKYIPVDAVFDNLEDVPEDVKANKRYAGSSKWTKIAGNLSNRIMAAFDILVHSLAIRGLRISADTGGSAISLHILSL
ncbi:hypothetical protein NC653_000100 [Populus alba x Populus x berolinensis]|uniref:Uncharacterized protein n=1 Tax=Populus alba x Populus x berolinensis TaxID=444605 RepID=A0AAD6RI22_9ROSI|nr:hypothetical protein NC653_000100 [Populus alba x Populus x berolinensis]